MSEKPKCFGWFAECPNEVPDGRNEDGDVLYWKISCPMKDDCYKDWFSVGGRLGYFDVKLLEKK